MERVVLTHATDEESRKSISQHLQIQGHLESRNKAVGSLNQKIIWVAAHSPGGPCCPRLGRARINISQSHLLAVAPRRRWKVMRPLDDSGYVFRGFRHDFYTLVLTHLDVPNGWREVVDEDAVQLRLTDTFWGFEVSRERGRFKHCHVAITVDALTLIASTPAAAKGVPARVNDILLLAVGRQYYTDCKCDEDIEGNLCCRQHCDKLFKPSARIALKSNLDNEEDLLAVEVFSGGRHVGHIAWFQCLFLHLLWPHFGGLQGKKSKNIELERQKKEKFTSFTIKSVCFMDYLNHDHDDHEMISQELMEEGRDYAVPPAVLSLSVPLPQRPEGVAGAVRTRTDYTQRDKHRAFPY